MLKTDDLDYQLPDRLIATHPTHRRDEARLMVLSRSDPTYVEHRIISDLPELLRENDLLVVNDTRVLPARLTGRRTDTGGKIEGLYLDSPDNHTWRMMLKSNGKLRPGLIIQFTGTHDNHEVRVRLLEKYDAVWLVKVIENQLCNHENTFTESTPQHLLDQVGQTPLPPYILKARRDRHEHPVSDDEDKKRYQTVYAGESAGAVAAPTAGLHFTDKLLAQCDARGMKRAAVTLHVGAGTFKPVDTEYLEEHPMHAEWFSISGKTIHELIQTRADQNKRIVAVGTTTVRTLESLPDLDNWTADVDNTSESGIARETRLLITPGFQFRYTDILLTNFHLPRSTLLALVGAFIGDVDRLKSAYEEAIQRDYRFYSYGDAMLILP